VIVAEASAQDPVLVKREEKTEVEGGGDVISKSQDIDCNWGKGGNSQEHEQMCEEALIGQSWPVKGPAIRKVKAGRFQGKPLGRGTKGGIRGGRKERLILTREGSDRENPLRFANCDIRRTKWGGRGGDIARGTKRNAS